MKTEPKGFFLKGQMVSAPDGELLFPGSLKLVQEVWEQPDDGDGPPVEYLQFEASTVVGGKTPLNWTFRLTRAEASRESLIDELQNRMPAGITIPRNNVLALTMAIDALSGPHADEEFPVRHYESWADESGTFWQARQVSKIPIQIVGEKDGHYRIRKPAPDGNGHVYADGLLSDVLGGRLPAEIASGSGITDPIRLGMSLTTVWNRLSGYQRSNLEKEDLTQQRKEATRSIDARLQRLA